MAEPFAPLGALLRSAGACAAGCLAAEPLLAQLEPARTEQLRQSLPGLQSLLCAAVFGVCAYLAYKPELEKRKKKTK